MSDGRFLPRLVGDHLQPVLPVPLRPHRRGFYITTGFVVLGVAAWLLRRRRAAAEAG